MLASTEMPTSKGKLARLAGIEPVKELPAATYWFPHTDPGLGRQLPVNQEREEKVPCKLTNSSVSNTSHIVPALSSI